MSTESKNKLANKIYEAFTQTQEINNREQAQAAARKTANDIATAVDVYIQEEIGSRLSIILESLSISSTAESRISVSLGRGEKFEDFVRKLPS